MKLIEVTPLGPLASRFPAIKIAANNVAEAIEGWSRQCGMEQIPLHRRPVIEAVGYTDRTSLLKDVEADRVELLPAVMGGGSFGRILLGAALIASTFILPGLNIALSSALKGALLATGVGMVAGGVLSFFMKAPGLSNEQNPDASKYIGNGKNSVAIGTPIGIGGGRMLVGGQLMSVNVNATDLVYGAFPGS